MDYFGLIMGIAVFAIIVGAAWMMTGLISKQ
jgi:hypothetical protein